MYTRRVGTDEVFHTAPTISEAALRQALLAALSRRALHGVAVMMLLPATEVFKSTAFEIAFRYYERAVTGECNVDTTNRVIFCVQKSTVTLSSAVDYHLPDLNDA